MSSRRCGLKPFRSLHFKSGRKERSFKSQILSRNTQHNASVARWTEMKLPGCEHTSLRTSKICPMMRNAHSNRLYQACFLVARQLVVVRKNTGAEEILTMDKDCGKMWSDKPVSVFEGQMEQQKWDRQWGIRVCACSRNCGRGHAKLRSAEMQASVLN